MLLSDNKINIFTYTYTQWCVCLYMHICRQILYKEMNTDTYVPFSICSFYGYLQWWKAYTTHSSYDKHKWLKIYSYILFAIFMRNKNYRHECMCVFCTLHKFPLYIYFLSVCSYIYTLYTQRIYIIHVCITQCTLCVFIYIYIA
jgi:hypothetical protein